MQLDTPFTERHGQCSVLSYLPYSWADVLDQDDCVLPYAVVKAQFKIIFVTLVAIHAAGVAHCNLKPSAVRLCQGLIPHIVGFEHSWNRTRKGTKDDRIHSEATYYPARLAGNNLKSDDLKGFTLSSMQLLDLYAYAALMVQVFFEVELTEGGHLDAVQSLKFDKVRERYRNEIDKNQFELLCSLIKYIIEQVQKENTIMKADICLLDQWFKDVPINKSRRYSHIA
jgi:serine/threonine protein kinase